MPTTNTTNGGVEQAEKRNSGELEFESELSGAFSLLSVEGSPSKVRTSDLGKLLLAIGAGEIAEIKPLESIVDINHSGFFTREKVTAALQKLREEGRFPSLDELSGRSASGRKASTAAKNKQQQKRLNDEEQMNQKKSNATKKILVVDDIGLCRRVRFLWVVLDARKLLFWIGLSSPRILLNFGSRTALSRARARSGNNIKQ